MSTGYVKEIAKEKHKPVSKIEHAWNEAKKAAQKSAEKEGKKVGYGYVTNIFKNMTHVGSHSKRDGVK